MTEPTDEQVEEYIARATSDCMRPTVGERITFRLGWRAAQAAAPPSAVEAPFNRDKDWILAMGHALGLDSGFNVPIVPTVEAFKRLFADIRQAAASPSAATPAADDLGRICEHHQLARQCPHCDAARESAEQAAEIARLRADVADLRIANCSLASKSICHGTRKDGVLTCDKGPCDLCLHWQYDRAKKAETSVFSLSKANDMLLSRAERAEAENAKLRTVVSAADAYMDHQCVQLAELYEDARMDVTP